MPSYSWSVSSLSVVHFFCFVFVACAPLQGPRADRCNYRSCFLYVSFGGKGQYGIMEGICDPSLMKIKGVSNGANKQRYFCLVWLILKILKQSRKVQRTIQKKKVLVFLKLQVLVLFLFLSKDTVGVPFVPLPGPIFLFLSLVLPLACFRCLESGLLLF